jgi:hypothetical protein
VGGGIGNLAVKGGKRGSKTTRKEKEQNALIRRVKERHPNFIIFLYYRQSIPNTSLKHIWTSICFFFFFFAETRKRLIAIKKLKNNHRNE